MMRLQGAGADLFEMGVDGYQFPDPGPDAGEYDLNWLFILGRCIKDGRMWEFRDPAALTWEIEDLADWFEGRAVRRMGRRRELDSFDFIEPVIAFSRILAGIRVHLSHEGRPSWAPHIYEGEFYIDVSGDSVQLSAAAASLRRMLDANPRRRPASNGQVTD